MEFRSIFNEIKSKARDIRALHAAKNLLRSMPMNDFEIDDVLEIEHSANTVVKVCGSIEGRRIQAYIKIKASKGGSISNEIKCLSELDTPFTPKVLDKGLIPREFLVTEEIPGINFGCLLDTADQDVHDGALSEFGRTLARLHEMKPDVDDIDLKNRFFMYPPPDYDAKHAPASEELSELLAYQIDFSQRCFCHGDYYPSNAMYNDGKISGILDFELAGYGIKEFDIAWAMIQRPNHSYFKSEEECDAFIKGYREAGDFDPRAVMYFMVTFYLNLIDAYCADEDYCGDARSWIERIAQASQTAS